MTAPQHEQPAGALEESSPGGLLRLRLDISYDGTDFHGWARQPGLRTVQGELEAALRAVLRVPGEVPVRVAVAGRTDAGVHAVGQVCHGDVPAASLAEEEWSTRLVRRLNGVLPTDVRVRRVGVALPGFDARWSASWREYSYLVADHSEDLDARLRRHLLTSRPLDVAAMHAAAQPFLGEHDFSAFCRSREGASTVRTILDLDWRRRPPTGAGPGLAEFRVRSDAFCHSMVRALVGSFLAVGEGRWPVQRPGELLDAAVRLPAVVTAPAHGLTLIAVGYPPDSELAQQTQLARRWRGR